MCHLFFLDGRKLNKRELRRLQSLFNHLHSEYPNLPDMNGDPEEFLAKLSAGGLGGGNQGLFFLDGGLFGDEDSSNSMDWNLAYDNGKLGQASHKSPYLTQS